MIGLVGIICSSVPDDAFSILVSGRARTLKENDGRYHCCCNYVAIVHVALPATCFVGGETLLSICLLVGAFKCGSLFGPPASQVPVLCARARSCQPRGAVNK